MEIFDWKNNHGKKYTVSIQKIFIDIVDIPRFYRIIQSDYSGFSP